MTEEQVVTIVLQDRTRAAVVDAVAELGLPDCWIAAGFVRNAVWDALYGRGTRTPLNDVDVVYWKSLDSYDVPADELTAAVAANQPNRVWDEEEGLSKALSERFPNLDFEVKNQARMHLSPARVVRDEPYRSSAEALARWVETATAVGIRKDADGRYELLAPYGLSDLVQGIVRPSASEYEERAKERAEQKGWFTQWPDLRFETWSGT